MRKRIPERAREEIIRLYDNGSGLSPAEIARQTGVSYSSVYGLTRIRQRVNPETGEPFESRNQYQEYTARQRVNRPENQGLSDLIKKRLKELGRNQSWLSREIGVSRQAVSKYVQGKYTPDNGVLEKMYSALEVSYQTLDDLLDDLYDE